MDHSGALEAGTGRAPAGPGAFQVQGIAKRFGETVVLRGVDLRINPGTVHGLVGANGAGKTTLMRILTGELRADLGQVVAGGSAFDVDRWNGERAASAGIAMVHQEVPVFGNLRVYEHFALVPTLPVRPWQWRREARARAAHVLADVFPAAGLSADRAVEDLGLARRQMLEIALAVQMPGLRLLVLDEPTSALGRDQVEEIKALIGRLKAAGVGVLLATHRLEEVLTLCDRITVLRDGVVARSSEAGAFDAEALVTAMGGAASAPIAAPSAANAPATRPVVEVVVPPGAPADALPLAVHPGEVVGLSGLAGSGQSELLVGVLRRFGPRAAVVSGDRRGNGIFPLWSTLRNTTVEALGRGRRASIAGPAERRMFDRWAARLRIQANDPENAVTTLSGGNQQKVLIARALAADPDVLLLDDPTRGVDAGTKREVYDLLRTTAAEGRAVLWHSTDDDEMLHCDRVYVMRDGFVRGDLRGPDVTREAIVAASFAPVDKDAAGTDGIGPRLWRAAPLQGLGAGWLLTAGVLVALLVATGVVQGSALAPGSLPILVSSFLPLVLAAAAELSVIAVSDIDLGLGAFMGLVNSIAATWLVGRPLLGGAAIIAFGLLYASQALLVGVRKVPAIIVTLGASFVWLGVALLILPAPGGSSPNWLTTLGNLNTPILPEPLLVSLLVAVAMTLVLFRTRLGVRIRAVGQSADGYRVRAGRGAAVGVRVAAYAVAALFAILAGLAMTALTSSADPNASQPDTLLAIAAVIIGGASFVGGRVDPVGAVLGALMFGLLEAFLGLTSINVNYTSLIEGAVLIGVLALRLVPRRGVRA